MLTLDFEFLPTFSPSSTFFALMQEHNKPSPSSSQKPKESLQQQPAQPQQQSQQVQQTTQYQQAYPPQVLSSNSPHFVTQPPSQHIHTRTTDTQQQAHQPSTQPSSSPTAPPTHLSGTPTPFQPLLQFPNLIHQPTPFVTPTQDAGLHQFLQQHLQQSHSQLLHQWQQLNPNPPPSLQYQPYTISSFPPPTIQPLTSFSSTQSHFYQTYGYPQLLQQALQSQPPSQVSTQAPQATQAPSQPLQAQTQVSTPSQSTQQHPLSVSLPVSLSTLPQATQIPLPPSLQQTLAQQQFQSSPPLSKKQPAISRPSSDQPTKKPRASPKPSLPPPPAPPPPSKSPSDSDSYEEDSSSDESSPQPPEFINYSLSYFNNRPNSPSSALVTPTTTTQEGQNVVTHATSGFAKGGTLQPAQQQAQAPLPRARSNAKPRKEIVIPSELLKVKQSEAARRLGMNNTRLSKRWRESNPDRKWPHRRHLKLGKKINMLLQLQQQGYEIDQAELRRLREKRERNIQPTTINVSEAVREPTPPIQAQPSHTTLSLPAPPSHTTATTVTTTTTSGPHARTPSPATPQQASPPITAQQHSAQEAQQAQIPSNLTLATHFQPQAFTQLTPQQLAQYTQHLAQQGYQAYAHPYVQYAQAMAQQQMTQQPIAQQQMQQPIAQQPVAQQSVIQSMTQQSMTSSTQGAQTTQLTQQQFQRLSPQGHSDHSPSP